MTRHTMHTLHTQTLHAHSRTHQDTYPARTKHTHKLSPSFSLSFSLSLARSLSLSLSRSLSHLRLGCVPRHTPARRSLYLRPAQRIDAPVRGATRCILSLFLSLFFISLSLLSVSLAHFFLLFSFSLSIRAGMSFVITRF